MMYNNKTIIVRDKLWPDDAKLESTQAFTILVGPRHLILCIERLTFFLIAAKLLFALGSRGLPRDKGMRRISDEENQADFRDKYVDDVASYGRRS